MSARIVAALTFTASLALAACGDSDSSGGDAATTSSESTSRTSQTTTTTPTADPVHDDMVPCQNPEGFTIAVPRNWSTNDGSVVPPCSQFHPEPFEVPAGTDERVAAITAYIDRVAFSRASQPRDARDEDRAVTAIDGRQAVRTAYEATGAGLYPEGTPITTYLVDVADQGDERTLFLDTIGVGKLDYDANVAVLDRMVRTLTLTDPALDTDPQIIATYAGGGGGFQVRADARGAQVCLRIPPNGEPVCTDEPAADQVHTIRLQDMNQGIPAGVTGSDVWRVDLVTRHGEEHSYLPAPVPGVDAGAYAFPDTVDGFRRLTLRGIDGQSLRTVEPGQA